MSLVSWVFALVGLAGLAKGADWLVDGSSGLARRFRVTPLVIGLTVVAYGTSAPEIGASLIAVLRDSPGLAVGNVIGSNAANLGLILGVTALAQPFTVGRGVMRREFALMLLATALLWPFAACGAIPRAAGLLFLAGLAAFNFVSVRWGRRTEGAPAPGGAASKETEEPLGKHLGLTSLGLLVLLVGADLLVRGASDIARGLGVSETTIGFTLVALGTSLPELAASVAAVRSGQVQMAAGNVIGSNLFNVLGALGLSAAAVPVAVDPALAAAEIPGVLAITLLAGFFMLTGRRMRRIEGALLVAAYAAYAGLVVL